MKLKFLEQPATERRIYFEQAATQRNLLPVILEKDFWVCWLLGVLFTSRFADVLVFKGGTSLSKVFGVIERFSEDIDLSLSPDRHCPKCQHKGYMFRARKTVDGGPGDGRFVETKYRCRSCAYEWWERIPEPPEIKRTYEVA